MNPSDLMGAVRAPASQPVNRAKQAEEMFLSAFLQYKELKQKLRPDESINFVCLIGGGARFDVLSVSIQKHHVRITSKNVDGDMQIISAPFEQIAFSVIVSKKIDDVPPREIGFKVENAIKQP